MAEKPTYEELEKALQLCETRLNTILKSTKESEFLFSQTFEHSTTSMCLYDPKGTIIKANREFCKMFGVEEKVIIY